LHDKLFNASHASLVFFTETSSLFWLNYTKMLIKTFPMPLWKRSRLWFHQSKLSLFRPFYSHQS